MKSSTNSSPRILAACYRAPFLAAAVLSDLEIIEVRRTRLSRVDAAREARIALGKIAAAYDVDLIVVEPNTLPHEVARSLRHAIRILRLATAKELLVADGKVTNQELFEHLVERYPSLRRFVTILPVTGRVAMTKRWKTAMLFPVALGLAAQRRPIPAPPANLPTIPPHHDRSKDQSDRPREQAHDQEGAHARTPA